METVRRPRPGPVFITSPYTLTLLLLILFCLFGSKDFLKKKHIFCKRPDVFVSFVVDVLSSSSSSLCLLFSYILLYLWVEAVSVIAVWKRQPRQEPRCWWNSDPQQQQKQQQHSVHTFIIFFYFWFTRRGGRSRWSHEGYAESLERIFHLAVFREGQMKRREASARCPRRPAATARRRVGGERRAR